MAVHHKLAMNKSRHILRSSWAKLPNDTYLFKLTQVKHVLPSALIGTNAHSIAIKHLHINQMDMNRMKPATSWIHKLPNFDVSNPG